MRNRNGTFPWSVRTFVFISMSLFAVVYIVCGYTFVRVWIGWRG